MTDNKPAGFSSWGDGPEVEDSYKEFEMEIELEGEKEEEKEEKVKEAVAQEPAPILTPEPETPVLEPKVVTHRHDIRPMARIKPVPKRGQPAASNPQR
jgi:hypothetical protein